MVRTTTIQHSKLRLIESEESKQLLSEIAIKLGYVALGYNDNINNTGLSEFINEYTELEFVDKVNSTSNSFGVQLEKDALCPKIINNIKNNDKVKEYNNLRNTLFKLLSSIEKRIFNAVGKFNDEKKKK